MFALELSIEKLLVMVMRMFNNIDIHIKAFDFIGSSSDDGRVG